MSVQELFNPADPFGGGSFPGNPMEHVLSLQSLSDSGDSPWFTNTCVTNLCDPPCETNTCSTNICSANTNACITSIC